MNISSCFYDEFLADFIAANAGKVTSADYSVIIETMRFNRLPATQWIKWAASANVLAAACLLYAADPAIITIASPNLFPESITSTSDGAIIIGSYGTSSIWRVPANENNAAKWIDASNAKGALLGVLAGLFPVTIPK